MRCLAAVLLLVFGLLACNSDNQKVVTAATVVRVGYFPNLTHAQALAGLARGDFASALGPGVRIEPTVFNAGPSVIEALFARRIDLAYVGPNPAINGFVQSHGEALKIVAGAMSGGAALVVRNDRGITMPADLSGRRLATPQLGNTQDVALRAFLARHGLQPKEKGGTVDVVPTPNTQIVDLIRNGQVDGAWVPEPWGSRLVVEVECRVLVDERDLWPRGDFVTAHIIVRRDFLETHRDVVRAWLDAHVSVTQWMLDSPDDAQEVVNAEVGRFAGKPLPPAVMAMAWTRMRATWDPIASSLLASADAAHEAGFLREPPNLSGIYDLSLLNDVLRNRGLAEIRVPE